MFRTATLGIAVITLMLSAGAYAKQDKKDIVETAVAELLAAELWERHPI